ncbi:MAG: polyphenol oxidase family protein [Acidobacteriota bacterium]|nr:MAG: polyphenol oxidase family protein [Acidobacteriota bacterium]
MSPVSLRCRLLDGTPHAFETGSPSERRESSALARGPVWRPQQVHGTRIVEARPQRPSEPADGAWSSRPGLGVAVVSADCVPLLLASKDRRLVAAVHAGWRGLAAGVIEAAVAAMAVRDGGRVAAALGPAAGGCCYEVDEPVVAALAPRDERLRRTRPGRWLLDLRGVAADRLAGAGLAASNIEIVGPCTICSPDWPSYRRQGERAGRLLAWIFPA